jgi:periplasmic protein TonB
VSNLAYRVKEFLLLAVVILLLSTRSEATPRGNQVAVPTRGNSTRSTQTLGQPPANEAKATQATSDAEGIYQVGNGVALPKVISSVDPEYTVQATRKKVSGGCVIGLVVDAQGNPRDIHVVKSTPEDVGPKLKKIAEGLDQNALKAVSQ